MHIPIETMPKTAIKTMGLRLVAEVSMNMKFNEAKDITAMRKDKAKIMPNPIANPPNSGIFGFSFL
jgi:hypothetical protein